MNPITLNYSIDASAAVVFEAISDVSTFPQIVPEVARIEFLSEQHFGIGTRFQETRIGKNGREQHFELEVTEHIENKRIRMVSDAGGAVWDTVFIVSPIDSGLTELDIQMEIRPYKFLAKTMLPFFRNMIVRGVETDMESRKSYCESQNRRNNS